MDTETRKQTDKLVQAFIENARENGVHIENIEVEWTDGRYDARVIYSLNKPTVEIRNVG